MNIKKHFTRLAFLFAAIVFIAACKKDEEESEFTGYTCQCGDVSWKGMSYPLLDANYIIPNDTISNSRKYYLTADVEGEDDSHDITHNLNIEIEIMDASPAPGMITGVFAPKQDTVEVRVEEVMITPSGTHVNRYRGTEGVIEVEPSVFGDPEPVSFSLNVRQFVEGNLIGFPEPLSGSFTVAPSN